MSCGASPDTLLVVPAYRESKRIEAPLRALCAACTDLPIRILVVDDGSGENEARATAAIVERIRSAFPALLEPLLLPRNLGKGGAIYAGWDHAHAGAQWLGFTDADGATPAGETARLARMLPQTNADFLIASRVKMLGRSVERTLKRHIFGRIFATFSTLLTGVAVYDSQCGCKFLRSSFYQKIRPYLHDTRFGFDMDLIAHADYFGARILEVPVDWSDIPGSKVSILRDGLRMTIALWRIRKSLRTLSHK